MANLLNKITLPFSRLALFAVYFWFGLLKVVGESPASPLVKSLFNETIAKNFSSVGFEQFIIAFGIFEMVVGLLFLLPRFEKIALILLSLHLISTSMPLFVLSEMVWVKNWVPTLEGQYIIKNLVILSLALNIYVHKKG